MYRQRSLNFETKLPEARLPKGDLIDTFDDKRSCCGCQNLGETVEGRFDCALGLLPRSYKKRSLLRSSEVARDIAANCQSFQAP
jgi:hypothetical protein